MSAAWAAGYLFIGAAAHVPPVTATAIMTGIAAIVVLTGVRIARRRPLLPTLRTRPWVPLVMGMSAIVIPNLTVVLAEHTVPPDVAALVGTTVPIATILLTTFVTHETPLSFLRLSGVFVALAGLAVFVGPGNLLSHPGELAGIAIMMSGGLVFALNGLFAARQTRDLDASVLSAWTLLFGAIYLGVAAFALEDPMASNPGAAIWALIAEGTLGMGLAYLGYYVLVARAGPGFASLYAFLVPVLGVLATAAVYGHPVTPGHLAGLTGVLLGLLLVTQADRLRRLTGLARH